MTKKFLNWRSLVYLAAGCLVSVLIAVGCALRVQKRFEIGFDSSTPYGIACIVARDGSRWGCIGYHHFGLSWLFAERADDSSMVWEACEREAASSTWGEPHYLVSIINKEAKRDEPVQLLQVPASGLPFRCLYSLKMEVGEGPLPLGPPDEGDEDPVHRVSEYSLELTGPRSATQYELPYGIVWSGMIMDSVFFGGGLMLVVRGPRAVIRWRRMRRRCCVNCGYSLKGSVSGVCPECGAGRIEKPAEEVRQA